MVLNQDARSEAHGGDRHEYRNTTPDSLPPGAAKMLGDIDEEDGLIPHEEAKYWWWHRVGQKPEKTKPAETIAIDHLVEKGYLTFNTDAECWILSGKRKKEEEARKEVSYTHAQRIVRRACSYFQYGAGWHKWITCLGSGQEVKSRHRTNDRRWWNGASQYQVEVWAPSGPQGRSPARLEATIIIDIDRLGAAFASIPKTSQRWSTSTDTWLGPNNLQWWK